MKKSTLTIIIFFLLLSACNDSGDCLSSYGETITETHEISSGLNRLHIDHDIDVSLVFDSTNKISITYGSHIIDNIKIKESANTLQLSNETKCIWNKKPEQHPEVRIHLSSLQYIQHSGYGKLDFKDTLITPEFKLKCINSAADVNLLLHTDFTSLKLISGPAKIEASGQSNEVYTYHSASGMIYAQKLPSGSVHSVSNGMGDTYIHAQDKLKAAIRSFGNIYYLGAPVISKNITGQGQLKPLNAFL